MAMSQKDKNDAVLHVLGHPIRRKLLHILNNDVNGGISPSMAAEELDASLGTVSYHFRALAETGVLKLIKTEPRRGAIEHYYKRAGNALDKKVGEMLGHIGKD